MNWPPIICLVVSFISASCTIVMFAVYAVTREKDDLFYGIYYAIFALILLSISFNL